MSNARGATPDRLLAERISHERELRIAAEKAFDHERELRALYDQHERELRLQAEAAVEKARMLQFDVYETRLDNLNHSAERIERLAGTFMTVERFEREHQVLAERIERGFMSLNEKLQIEERVTTRAAAQDELLARLGTNNRWMVGILVTLGIFGATMLLHVFGVL